MGNKCWYSVEIAYNTRVMMDRVDKFREWLNDNLIKHETSGCFDMIHFEIECEPDQVHSINEILDQIVFFDSICNKE